jgi:RimJ/RimL family protein N-acetyltransferase
MRQSSEMQESLDWLILRWRAGEGAFPLRLIRAAQRRFWYRREKRIYRFPTDLIAALPNARLLRRDRLEDLDCYERTGSWQMTTAAYREAARTRLKHGQHFYSLVEGGRLLHYAWLKPRHDEEKDLAVGQVFFPPPGSAALCDHYTHPLARGRGLYREAIHQLLHDAREVERADHVYIYVFADNHPSRRVIEKVGFRYVGSMIQEGRLRAVRRWSVSAGGEFSTALL